MIAWYQDKRLSIFFSKEPNIRPLYPSPDRPYNSSKVFKNLEDFAVIIFDHKKKKKHQFVVEEDYEWDGASIARIFWRLIDSPTNPKFIVPSLIHDKLCENHELVGNDRYLSTLVFERLLRVSGVVCWKRWLMKHSVDNFQKFCHWDDNELIKGESNE